MRLHCTDTRSLSDFTPPHLALSHPSYPTHHAGRLADSNLGLGGERMEKEAEDRIRKEKGVDGRVRSWRKANMSADSPMAGRHWGERTPRSWSLCLCPRIHLAKCLFPSCLCSPPPSPCDLPCPFDAVYFLPLRPHEAPHPVLHFHSSTALIT